ncbi:immunoglobulin superfamily member 10-like [Syngnathoides biaculeatus]|uniref:immunoglobulin superfamily member 10-like n=1 Tax=Syngnathoides biaculeatus TaxID=300417 RepID=UPI002ADE82BF|nr:immunoglobulin superfamily member 10-like [Syngnathoides biaculeatus]
MKVCPCVGLVVALWALVVPGGQACPRSCNCYQANEVHCTFRSLLTVPAGLPSHTRRINMGFNSISRLYDSSLARLQRLELLMLHSNDIHHLPDALFRDLKSLQILKLSYNKLTEIPSSQTFYGLTSLLRLYLDHNHLQYIYPRALLQLPSLRLLRLQGNRLHQLHPHALCTLSLLNTYYFSTLRHLDVSNNSLTTLPRATLQTAPMLETLALQANPWSCDCRMSWFPAWRFAHQELTKCSGGLQCPMCESPNARHGKGLLDQKDLTCTSPVITLWKEETPSETELVENEQSESFSQPLGTASLDLSDQQGNNVELRCNVTYLPDSQDESTPDLSLPSSSPVAMALSFSLHCPVERESYERVWRILAYYSETAVHLERELMVNKPPDLTYQYRQAAETEGYYNTGVKASVSTGPHWLMQPAIGIQLNRARSSRNTVNLIYSTRVSAHPDPTTDPATSATVSQPWVLILTNYTTAITAAAGSRIELSCPVLSSGHPRIQWILPDRSTFVSPSSSQDGRIQVTGTRLLLQNVELSNAGIYYCVAQAGKDSDVLSLYLAVEASSAPPTGEQVGPPVTGLLGQPVSLSCKASGSPEPRTFWVLPDGNIVRKGLTGLGEFTMQSNGTLFFPNPSLRDAGHYRCVAVNQYGSASLSMSLEINSRKRLSLGDVPGGPQSASGRSTKIRAPLLRQVEEGSGDEVEEEERIIPVHQKHSSPLQKSQSNRQKQVRKPIRRGPLREGPLRRGGRPLSPEQRRNRYTTNKQKIDPLKWADLLAKIRQKTAVTNNSEDMTTEKATAKSSRIAEDRERHGGGDNTETEGAAQPEMEGSSVDDAVLQEESLQPIYPTHTVAVLTQASTESKTGTKREESSEAEKHENEAKNVTPPQTTTQTDLVTSKPTFRTNEIDPDTAGGAEQEAKPTSSRVRPSKPHKGAVSKFVPNTRLQNPRNSRRRIGQRRRVISRTRGQIMTPRQPLPDSLNPTAKSVMPDVTITQILTTTSSPTKLEETENIKTPFSTTNGMATPSPRSVFTAVGITPSTSDLPAPTLSSPALLPHYNTETNTDVMTHSGNITDSAKSPVFKSQTPTATDSHNAHTSIQTTLSLNDDRSSGEKGEGLEKNLLDVLNVPQFSSLPAATLFSAVSLTTTPSNGFANNPVTTSASVKSAATFDDTHPTSTTLTPMTADPIPLTSPPRTPPMYQRTESATTYSTLISTSPTAVTHSSATLSQTTNFYSTENTDSFKDIQTTTIPALPTSDSSTPISKKSATPVKIPQSETESSASSIFATTTAAASSTAASSGERLNTGQISPRGRPVSGQSRPPTDWRNPGANFIPDSHSSRPLWSPSPLPAAPRSPILRSRPRIADPHIRTVSFPAGNVARLTCEAQGEPKPSITWTKVATGDRSETDMRAFASAFILFKDQTRNKFIWK